jgi:hypothetical protein
LFLITARIHTVAGAVSGAMNSAITGSDIGMGMLTGAVGAAIGAAAGGALSYFKVDQFGYQLVARTVTGGVAGGVVSEIYGGNFWQGFAQGAGTAAAGFLFNEVMHEMEKYRQQQLQRQERFNKWVQDQGWYETVIGGQRDLVDKSGNPIDLLRVKFEGGNLRMFIAGAQIGATAKWLFTVPHPVTYTVGGAILVVGYGIMWMALPSVHFQQRY